MEYIDYALSRGNSQETKNIILYLSKHGDREVDREELLEKLNLTINDRELEKKLAILVNSDIIEQGVTNYDFHGVRDNIFDKVFRGVYQKEINGFDPKEISNEYRALYEKALMRYSVNKGKYSKYRKDS